MYAGDYTLWSLMRDLASYINLPDAWYEAVSSWALAHQDVSQATDLAFYLACDYACPEHVLEALKNYSGERVAPYAASPRVRPYEFHIPPRPNQGPLPAVQQYSPKQARDIITSAMSPGKDAGWFNVPTGALLGLLTSPGVPIRERELVMYELLKRDLVNWKQVPSLDWELQAASALGDPYRFEQAGCWNSLSAEQSSILSTRMLHLAIVDAPHHVSRRLRGSDRATTHLPDLLNSVATHNPQLFGTVALGNAKLLLKATSCAGFAQFLVGGLSRMSLSQLDAFASVFKSAGDLPWDDARIVAVALDAAGPSAVDFWESEAPRWNRPWAELADLAVSTVTLGVPAKTETDKSRRVSAVPVLPEAKPRKRGFF